MTTFETIDAALGEGNYRPAERGRWTRAHWEIRWIEGLEQLEAWRNGHLQMRFDLAGFEDQEEAAVAIECIFLPAIAMEGEYVYE